MSVLTPPALRINGRPPSQVPTAIAHARQNRSRGPVLGLEHGDRPNLVGQLVAALDLASAVAKRCAADCPECGAAVSADGPSRSELLATYLSDDERSILRALLLRQPCQAIEVLSAVAGRVGKSNFWSVWKQLQVRGLIAEEGREFAAGVQWVRALVLDEEANP